MHYFVVDIGTTHLKAAVFKPGRRHIETVEKRISLADHRDGTSEQQPEEIFQALMTLLSRGLAKYPDVKKVIFSAQMHSLLLTDATGAVIQPSMIWSDKRAQMQAQYFQNSDRRQALYEISGTPIHAMSPLMKLLYLRLAKPMLFLKHQPVYAMGIKTYIMWQLTGQRVTDYATASTTGLMALQAKDWSDELLAIVRLERGQLPRLVPVSSHFQITAAVAAAYQLPADLQFYIGSTDGALANLSLAAADDKGVVFSFGTSGALRYTSPEIKFAADGELFCYLIDDTPQYIIGGAFNNAGNVLEWLYSRFGYDERLSFAEMLVRLTNRAVQAKGPLFLPYLNGERAPFWNGHLRASFQHMQASDQRDDLAKAVIEGVFFHARLVLDRLAATIGRQSVLYVNGKIFQTPEQLQWIADMLNTKLCLKSIADASILGAAILLEKELAADRQTATISAPETVDLEAVPNAMAARIYTEKYQQFVALAEQHHQAVLAEQKKLQNELLKTD